MSQSISITIGDKIADLRDKYSPLVTEAHLYRFLNDSVPLARQRRLARLVADAVAPMQIFDPHLVLRGTR